MDDNEIRIKILQILYERDKEYPHDLITREEIKKCIPLTNEDLAFNMRYLEDKNLVTLQRLASKDFDFFTSITSKGIDAVESGEIGNNTSKITQNIIHNSPGTVINSTNVSVNIQDSFNQIYKGIIERNSEKKEEIIKNVETIENELKKEKIQKSRIQKCFKWLQNNAFWTIDPLTQILIAILTGTN